MSQLISFTTGALVEEEAEAGDNNGIDESRVRIQVKPMNIANRIAALIPIYPSVFIAIKIATTIPIPTHL